MYTAPVFPINVVPEPINKAPLLPELAEPVLKTNNPLTPDVPELAVLRRRTPLDPTELYPLVSNKRPPFAEKVV